jgi:hypothetical protein
MMSPQNVWALIANFGLIAGLLGLMTGLMVVTVSGAAVLIFGAIMAFSYGPSSKEN